MKKLLNTLLILLSVFIAFTACSMQESLSEELVSVSLTSSSTARSLIADVDFDVSKVATWKYTAVKADNGLTTGQTGSEETDAEDLIDGKTELLSVGNWNFKLYGYDTEGKIVCSGAVENTLITTKSYKINITVKPSQNGGTGKIVVQDVTIISKDSSKSFSSGEEYTMSYAVYKKTDSAKRNPISIEDGVNSGAYNIVITFNGKVDDSTTYEAAKATKLINVYDNLTTTVSGTIVENAKSAVITSEGTIVDEGTATVSFVSNVSTEEKTISVSSTPVGSSKKTTVSFPVGSLSNNTTMQGEVKLTVQASSIEAASETYVVEVSEGSVVAGFDFNLTGAETTFATGVTVKTYIEPGLDESKLLIKYVGDDVTETDDNKAIINSYTPASGLLEFTVHHFSKYVLTSSEVIAYDYDTLWNGIKNNNSIRLIRDITPTARISVNRGGAVVDINLNGHTISANFTPFLIQAGHLKFSGEGTVADLGDTYSTSSCGAVIIQPPATVKYPPILTVEEGVTLKGWSGVTILPYSATLGHVKAGIVNLNGKIDSSSVGIYINGNVDKMDEGYPCTININDGAEINATSAGIYAAGYAIWNIGNAKITSGTVFSLKSGTFTINGGEFTATGEDQTTLSDTAAVDSSNGAVLTGAVLSMTSNKSYANKLDVTVKGGTFKSTNSCAVYEGIPSNLSGTTSYVTLSIENGTFTGNTEKVAVLLNTMTTKNVIKGGTFSSDPTAYLVSDYTATKDDTAGTWTVTESNSI